MAPFKELLVNGRGEKKLKMVWRLSHFDNPSTCMQVLNAQNKKPLTSVSPDVL